MNAKLAPSPIANHVNAAVAHAAELHRRRTTLRLLQEEYAQLAISIAETEFEIAGLEAQSFLAPALMPVAPEPVAAVTKTRRKMSAAGRKRIAEATKKRWAEKRAATAQAAKVEAIGAGKGARKVKTAAA